MPHLPIFKARPTLLLAAGVLAAAGLRGPVHADAHLHTPAVAVPTGPTITVTGDAAVSVVPDRLVLRGGVVTYATELVEAVADNDARSTEVRAAVAKLGVFERDLRLDDLTVEIRYTNRPEREIVGFHVTRSLSITLKSIALADRLVTAFLESGANRIDGIAYQTRDLRRHRDEARALAMFAAGEKAAAIASAAGMGVGPPRSIRVDPSPPWPGKHRGFGGQNVLVDAPADSGGDTGNTPAGEIAVTASVHVTYELTPAGQGDAPPAGRAAAAPAD